ncbi:MAG: hypothetical protein JWQ07_4256 [Ramlibacter sp.]|nr:hypothetical protein [Ramlibacter sp.]
MGCFITRCACIFGCAGVVGCAGVGGFDPLPDAPGSVRTAGGQSLPPAAALDAISAGKSTKAEVAAALGKAVVIPFESGYEVWVYRWKGAKKTTRAATELVVLFAPSGIARKARIRPGYETGD